MTKINWERWGVATGYVVVALGIAGAAFERGAPTASAPAEEILSFMLKYRSELLMQSLLFVLSAGVYFWFFGSLRSYLMKGEGDSGRLATVTFGAGVVWAGLQMILQSLQVALAIGVSSDIDPAFVGIFSDLMYALSVIAYVPMAIVLLTVAVVSFRTDILPGWIAWLSLVCSLLNIIMVFGMVSESALLVPGGAFTYMLYALMPIWLLLVTTVMFVRLRKSKNAK